MLKIEKANEFAIEYQILFHSGTGKQVGVFFDNSSKAFSFIEKLIAWCKKYGVEYQGSKNYLVFSAFGRHVHAIFNEDQVRGRNFDTIFIDSSPVPIQDLLAHAIR